MYPGILISETNTGTILRDHILRNGYRNPAKISKSIETETETETPQYHYSSCQQCRTVSTVSTVIARCYLHLRWYLLKEFHDFFLFPNTFLHKFPTIWYSLKYKKARSYSLLFLTCCFLKFKEVLVGQTSDGHVRQNMRMLLRNMKETEQGNFFHRPSPARF